MKMFTNDRFLSPGQALKIALVDVNSERNLLNDRSQAYEPTTSGNLTSNKHGATVPEIDAQIEMRKDGKRIDIQLLPLPRKHRANLKVMPTLAFEVPHETLSPGIYEIRATRSNKSLDSTPVVILPDEIYRKAIQQYTKEEFLSEGGTKFTIQGSWERSWQELLAYMNLAEIPQINMKLRLPSESKKNDVAYEASFYYEMGRQRFEWVAFHLSRFILDRALFGAEVHLGKSTRESGSLELRIKSQFQQSKLAHVPRQYAEFINSVRYESANEGFSIHLMSSDDEDRVLVDFDILRG